MRVLSAGQTRAPAAAAAGARAAARPVVAAADRCAALGTSRPSLAPRRPAAPARAAAAQDQAAAAVAAPVNPYDGEQEWYAVVANAEWLFNDVQNEALAEQLRELKRYYEEQGRERDFFFVSEPAWLAKHAEGAKVGRPCAALVSTDKVWITFMKLRLDRVLKLDLGRMGIDEATKSGAPLPTFTPPAVWRAPYSPYEYGWWSIFMRE